MSDFQSSKKHFTDIKSQDTICTLAETGPRVQGARGPGPALESGQAQAQGGEAGERGREGDGFAGAAQALEQDSHREWMWS